MGSTSVVLALIEEIRTHLLSRGSGEAGIDEVLRGLDAVDLSPERAIVREPQQPPPGAFLKAAIDVIPRPELGPLAEALEAARPRLHWRQGGTYERAEIGAAYQDGHMFCDLVGPREKAGVFPADDFRLGLFLLGPRVFYRDHNHPAPELYFALTGPTGWRFGHGPWQDLPAGTAIWNEPGRVHATRVYDQPFLTVYSWTRSVLEKCTLHRADDWPVLEGRL